MSINNKTYTLKVKHAFLDSENNKNYPDRQIAELMTNKAIKTKQKHTAFIQPYSLDKSYKNICFQLMAELDLSIEDVCMVFGLASSHHEFTNSEEAMTELNNKIKDQNKIKLFSCKLFLLFCFIYYKF